MKRFWILFISLMVLFTVAFVLVEEMDILILKDPSYLLDQGGFIAAGVGVGLLVADIALPVPSSLVMIAHGALFGLGIGALLSLVGGLAASMVGHGLGRMGEQKFRRFITEKEYERAKNLFDRWGSLAVLVTRPVPIFAETVAVVAGSSGLDRKTMFLASIVGLLPASLLYAAVGVYAFDWEAGTWAFLIVIAMAIGLGIMIKKKKTTYAKP